MFTIREAVWPRDKPAAQSFTDGLQGNTPTRAVYAEAGFSDYALQLRKYL